MLRELHNSNPKEFLLCGPTFLKYKEIHERINQYNLKNKDKKVEVSDERLSKSPEQPTIPRLNRRRSHTNEEYTPDTESVMS